MSNAEALATQDVPARPAGGTNSVLVISSGNPEVDWLAGELSRRGDLRTLVRRYANLGRRWEKVLAQVPGIGNAFSNAMGLRVLLPAQDPSQVVEAGIAYDFLSAAMVRSGLGRLGLAGSDLCSRLKKDSIARKGASSLGSAKVVVGNYGVSWRAFERIKQRGGRAVLNYPNAHHRFQQRFLAEEAEREPEFAAAFSNEISASAQVFDRECELADTILVGSSFVRRTFQDSGLNADKLAVVPYGCDVSMFAPREDRGSEDVFRAIFVGQLAQRKGLSYLLKGYRAFQGPGTELLLAGRLVGDPAALVPYKDSFTALGVVSHSRLPELYRQADVFLFPTLIEGMPLVVLEAMASGLPVITTNHGPGDIVRDGVDGFIVPIRDPEAIADRLEALRSNPEMRIAMGQSARARALEFTWERYCTRAADAVLGGGLAAATRGA